MAVLMKPRAGGTIFRKGAALPRFDSFQASKLGDGVNTLQFSFRSKALDLKRSGPAKTTGFKATYFAKYVENQDELLTSLRLDANASLSGVSGEASLEVAFSKHVQIDDSSVYLYATFEEAVFGFEVKSPWLADVPMSALKKASNFLPRFGDKFVSSIVYGKKLYVVFQFTKRKDVEDTYLRADMKARYGAGVTLSAALSLTNDISTNQLFQSYSIYVFSAGFEPTFVQTVPELVNMINKFLADHDEKIMVELSYGMSYYNACYNIENEKAPTLDKQRSLLRQAGGFLLLIDRIKATCDAAANSPKYYSYSDDQNITSVLKTVNDYTDRLNDAATPVIELSPDVVQLPSPPDFSQMKIPTIKPAVYVEMNYSGADFVSTHEGHSGENSYQWVSRTENWNFAYFIVDKLPFRTSDLEIVCKATMRNNDGIVHLAEQSLSTRYTFSPDNDTLIVGFEMGLRGRYAGLFVLEYGLIMPYYGEAKDSIDHQGLGPFIGFPESRLGLSAFRLRLRVKDHQFFGYVTADALQQSAQHFNFARLELADAESSDREKAGTVSGRLP